MLDDCAPALDAQLCIVDCGFERSTANAEVDRLELGDAAPGCAAGERVRAIAQQVCRRDPAILERQLAARTVIPRSRRVVLLDRKSGHVGRDEQCPHAIPARGIGISIHLYCDQPCKRGIEAEALDAVHHPVAIALPVRDRLDRSGGNVGAIVVHAQLRVSA